ncbi:hypothetical protein N9H63_00175 [bacterium]|nr:hypothetical protein [bacterium]
MDNENINETYLLFVFGNFTDESKVYDVGQSIIFSTTDEALKYIYGPYHMIVKIKTDIPFYEFKQFIYQSLKDDQYEYFLMPMSENSSAKLPKNLAENLFDLKNDNDNIKVMDSTTIEKVQQESKQMDDELDKIISYFAKDIEFNFDIEDEEDIDPMLVPKLNLPTFDDLLDKMVDEGIDSLTKEEKLLLDRYANEYKQ